MHLVLYLATGLSGTNTLILLLAYLWDSSVTLFGGATGYGLRPDGVSFTLSLLTTALLAWYALVLRRRLRSERRRDERSA
ncbi:hypothetical protein [Azospirillum himalayense]|uniref:Uncharacterized protein n=1 Tax=Azospirillum himalayense TaxID=654847 RepID=A0ABW0GF94_9PROT